MQRSQRKNQENKESPNQIVEFQTLKRKKTEQADTVNFYRRPDSENTFMITNTTNSLLTLFLLNSFINVNRPDFLKNKKDGVFADFQIENVPQAFLRYSHERTMEQIWDIVRERCTCVEMLEQMYNEYPIVEFLLHCYARKLIRDQIDENMELDLLGNEHKLLIDYEAELRGPILNILADLLKMEVTINFEGSEDFQENYGSNKAAWKVFVYPQDNCYRFEVFEEETHQLLSIHSAKNIHHHSDRRKPSHMNESEATETTADGQSYLRANVISKSANKDSIYRCKTCGSKVRFCECEQKKKQVTPKTVHQKPFGNPIFQGLDRLNSSVRRTREDVSMKLCYSCNRLACTCKK